MADNSAPIVSNRPKDDAFHQQRLQTWQPILSPMNVILIFLIIGVAFIPTGIGLMSLSNSVYEDIAVYGSTDKGTCNTERCLLDFQITEDIDDDIYVYYELTNFYQNHRLYVKSQSVEQLLGQEITDFEKLKSDCDPKLYAEDDSILWPCGLIANSFFNDVFRLEDSKLTMDEKNIAWKSDFEKFQNPPGFKYKKLGNSVKSCQEASLPENCRLWQDDNLEYYAYWYPGMGPDPQSAGQSTKDYPKDYTYLFETYPQISPIAGLQDEHFMVWMRTAALSTFRKIYGKIEGPFTKGQTLIFEVENRFDVKSYGGTKALVISTLTSMGGKNAYIGTAFLVVGCISILLTAMFVLKHLTSDRRKLGDTNLLRWDD